MARMNSVYLLMYMFIQNLSTECASIFRDVFLPLACAEDIRLYFGEAVALYFTFLGFYTTALLVPMFLGFLQLFLPTESIAFFCVFNVLWMTVFLEVSTHISEMLFFS